VIFDVIDMLDCKLLDTTTNGNKDAEDDIIELREAENNASGGSEDDALIVAVIPAARIASGDKTDDVVEVDVTCASKPLVAFSDELTTLTLSPTIDELPALRGNNHALGAKWPFGMAALLSVYPSSRFLIEPSFTNIGGQPAAALPINFMGIVLRTVMLRERPISSSPAQDGQRSWKMQRLRRSEGINM
jgi:hypothetical protein